MIERRKRLIRERRLNDFEGYIVRHALGGLLGKKILFYPSSGRVWWNISPFDKRIRRLVSMGYDAFVFCDYFPPGEGVNAPDIVTVKEFGGCSFLLLNCDNNIAREIMEDIGLRISCFVGVNDGCGEGGNYECVNDPKWLLKVFRLFDPKKGGRYITDHSKALEKGLMCECKEDNYEKKVRKIKRHVGVLKDTGNDPHLAWSITPDFVEFHIRCENHDGQTHLRGHSTHQNYPFNPTRSRFLADCRVKKHGG